MQKGFKQYIRLPITPFGGTKSTAGCAIGVYEELILWIIAIVLPALCPWGNNGMADGYSVLLYFKTSPEHPWLLCW